MHEFWALLGIDKVDPTVFLLNCPRQKAREFTIASSPKASPDKITLCVSLSSHEVPSLANLAEQLKACGCLPDNASASSDRPRFFGACSSFITCRMKAGSTVFAKFRPSAFHLPEKDVPVIMVGAGAGVAPFRGFWEELRRGTQAAPAALFFGCRHPEQDWLFKEEMNNAVKKQSAGCAALARVQAAGPKKPLTCLFTAFSRPDDASKKEYVQDHVRKSGQSVKHWIQNMKGYVFICGSTAMGNGVLDALAEILEGGKEAVEALRKEGRIVAEMWG
jgi:sulfite reductase alpha subunit-like flavoprotein